MAYGNYPPYFYPQMQAQQAVAQTQTSGFVSVRSEAEARNYPVAFGNSVTFRDENAPYIYTKSMGFSQLDRPIFDKYKLVKEEPQKAAPDIPNSSCDTKNDNGIVQKLQKEIEAIWSEIEALKNKGVEIDECSV